MKRIMAAMMGASLVWAGAALAQESMPIKLGAAAVPPPDTAAPAAQTATPDLSKINPIVDPAGSDSVTVDYTALPAPVSERGPRIVLRRPASQASAATVPVAPAPTASPMPPKATAAPTSIVTLTPPASQLAPTPVSPETPKPQVAALPPANLGHITPTIGPSNEPASMPPQATAAPAGIVTVTPPVPQPAPVPTAPERSQAQLTALAPATLGLIVPPTGPSNEPAPTPLWDGTVLASTHSPAAPITDHSQPAAQSESGAVRFAPGDAELQGDATAVLNSLAQKLQSSPQERIQLVAYASGNSDQVIDAHRMSLARVVVVRAYLIQRGVPSSHIDVRALGNQVEDGGSADRVDLVTLGQ